MPALRLLLLAAVAIAVMSPARAAVFKWANDGDARAMDPDTLDETFQTFFLDNIYEPLVRRGRKLEIEPALAASWEQVSPTVWRFHLRPGVKFQDGTPMSADDVLFSFARITSKASIKAPELTQVAAIRKIDDLTVDVETHGPDPIVTAQLVNMDIMSQAWAQAHGATEPAVVGQTENYAIRNANGTGPFRVTRREPDHLTVLEKNTGWWDKPEHNLDRVEFYVITNAATRVAALLSDEMDLIYSVPPQDMERIDRTPGFRLITGPEMRTIYLGMDQSRPELLKSNVKGKNPFKDLRVRQAFQLAIDEDAIASRIMRGQARPTAVLWGPGVNGYDPAIDKRKPADPVLAKKLLADAGYPDGFQVTLDCPNDRYINDAAICSAIAAMLARVGITVDVDARTKAKFFAEILAPNYTTSFYLLGWTPTTYDAHTGLDILLATRNVNGRGGANAGGYSNPRIDELTTSIGVELDPTKRLAMIDEAAKILQDDVAIIPLHQQVIVWAAKTNVDVTQPADDTMPFRWITVK